MVIVEGPDGSGKTVLVQALQARFDLKIAERPATQEERSALAVEETLAAIVEAVAGVMPPKVYDRLFFSELIYADAMERECAFSRLQSIYMLSLLGTLQCPVILCLPPLDVVTVNVLESEQMDGVVEQIHRLWYLYQLAFMAFPSLIHYDYTQGGTRGRIFSQVAAYLNLRERRLP